MTQIQVQVKQGLTFAEAARGILRLDPDVILFGEMRDAASATEGITTIAELQAVGGFGFYAPAVTRSEAGASPNPSRWTSLQHLL